ncbi:uncharacterized protein FFMR_11814 [Fusarium fujikuroi]|nr:uncharacterized protein FFMR_11814 [Fusarium fujikuroi]
MSISVSSITNPKAVSL